MNLPATTQTHAIVKAKDQGGADVGHLSRMEVDLLREAAQRNAKTELAGIRDSLLITLLFDGGLRITEVVGRSEKEAERMTQEVRARIVPKPGRPRKIQYHARPGITLADFSHDEHGWLLRVIGKGNKPAQVAVSTSLVPRLMDYAHRAGIGRNDPLFPVSRSRAHQILTAAYKAAGVQKPPGVGSVHVLRHSGAIDLLEQTGDPKMVQDQLRHSDPRMTLRYLKTVARQHSTRRRQAVDNGW